MMQNKYVYDPYPLQVTMQRLAENLKARRLEKKLSTKSLAEMSGVPASSIQRFELKHSISLESYRSHPRLLNSSSAGWHSMSLPITWMTMHATSVSYVVMVNGRWLPLTT